MDIIHLFAIEVCQGNPGALTFYCEAMNKGKTNQKTFQKVISGFGRMRENNIKGSKLYMLWNDCLDRNTDRAIYIMLHDTIESIIEHINYDGGVGIPYKDNEPRPYHKEPNGEWWIFTFLNDGSDKAGKCVKIKGTYGEARAKMIEKYGTHFAFQYEEGNWEKNWNDPDREHEMEDVIEIIR